MSLQRPMLREWIDRSARVVAGYYGRFPVPLVVLKVAADSGGGVRGALAGHAEATYTSLPSAEHRALARALFLRLIEPGASEQDMARRRVAMTELALPDTRQSTILREAAAAFIAARLLITNEVSGTSTLL